MHGLLDGLGQLFLLCLLVIACGAVLVRTARAAFTPGTSQQKTAPGGRGRTALRSGGSRPAIAAGKTAGRSAAAAVRHPGNRQIRAQARADSHTAWETARSTDWLEQRRHERQNGTANGGTATATRPKLRERLRLRPWTRTDSANASGNGGTNGANGNGHANGSNGSTPVPAPANGSKGIPPPPQASSQPAPASTNGGTPVAAGTSTASAEKLIEGINEIHAHAAAGNIHAKREAIKAAHEGSIRFAAMVQMLARQLAEPGSHYGPEITEPIARSGQHHQAAAMSLSEADAALSTLINMSVGELATSPRQAPHHAELTETGSH